MDITIERTLGDADTERAYGWYRAAFAPLVTRAAARHLLTAGEFAEEMADVRLEKYVARRDGRPVGLTVVTDVLAAVPWIEPGFYAGRYPDHVANRTLLYLCYVVVDPASRGLGAATAMTEMIFDRCARHGGVLAWDVCAFNNRRGVGGRGARLPATHGARVEALDTQTYYTAVFDGSAAP